MDSRQHDLQQLRSEYGETRNPDIKRAINEAGTKIRNESGQIRSAREALIRETRKKNNGNIKDIQNDIYNRLGGKNK